MNNITVVILEMLLFSVCMCVCVKTPNFIINDSWIIILKLDWFVVYALYAV